MAEICDYLSCRVTNLSRWLYRGHRLVGEMDYFQLKHRVMDALLDVYTEDSEVDQKRERDSLRRRHQEKRSGRGDSLGEF